MRYWYWLANGHSTRTNGYTVGVTDISFHILYHHKFSFKILNSNDIQNEMKALYSYKFYTRKTHTPNPLLLFHIMERKIKRSLF